MKQEGAPELTSRATIPGRAPAPAPRVEAVPIRGVGDLPKYVAMPAEDKARFAVPAGLAGEILVFKLIDDRFGIICTTRQNGGAAFAALTARLRENHAELGYIGVADIGLIGTIGKTLETQVRTTDLDPDEAQKSQAQEAISELIIRAIQRNASDVHIEVRATEAKVKLRVNGALKDETVWTRDHAEKVSRALHTAGDPDSKPASFSDKETQQWAVTMSVAVPGEKGSKEAVDTKLRVQTVEAYPSGYDLVSRVLKVGNRARVRSLAELGYHSSQIEMIDMMTAKKSGAVVLIGTTGSGKSTTLQTIINDIWDRNNELKIITVEDPPEYVLPATQIPVKRSANGKGNAFLEAMKAAMRLDPDWLVPGEIRDVDSAGMLVSMVQSGHKVATTLHAAGTFDAFARLEKNGIDRETLASPGFIAGMIYQVLIPVLCGNCKTPLPLDETGASLVPKRAFRGLFSRLKALDRGNGQDRFFLQNEEGCDHCDGGIVGRSVCADVLIPDDEVLRQIIAGNITAAMNHWRDKRNPSGGSMVGATALDHAVSKMRAGQCSPVDVEEALGYINEEFTRRAGVDSGKPLFGDS